MLLIPPAQAGQNIVRLTSGGQMPHPSVMTKWYEVTSHLRVTK